MAASKTEKVWGMPEFSFGRFEWLKTVNWMTLVWTLLAATVTFFMTDVIPALQSVGGVVATLVATIVVPMLIAFKQWITDNSEKAIVVKK